MFGAWKDSAVTEGGPDRHGLGGEWDTRLLEEE
jgi:hypothetical protein